jgi:membrane glycosyltransferase
MPSGGLLVMTLTLLLGPKLLALVWLSVDDRLRDNLGGTRRVVASVLIEIPLSVLVAPITMLTQTVAIIDIVRGRPSGWAPQRRSADGIAFADAWSRYRWHLAVSAFFWIAILAGIDGVLWTLSVAISLAAAPWVAMASARVDLGDWLATKGLFLAQGESADAASRFTGHRWAESLRPRSDQRLLKP